MAILSPAVLFASFDGLEDGCAKISEGKKSLAEVFGSVCTTVRSVPPHP